jgi:hypothetical protein
MEFYYPQLANQPPTYRCAKYFPDRSIVLFIAANIDQIVLPDQKE